MVDDLNDMIIRQGKDIAFLQKQNHFLTEALRNAQTSVKPEEEETPPPHYWFLILSASARCGIFRRRHKPEMPGRAVLLQGFSPVIGNSMFRGNRHPHSAQIPWFGTKKTRSSGAVFEKVSKIKAGKHKNKEVKKKQNKFK